MEPKISLENNALIWEIVIPAICFLLLLILVIIWCRYRMKIKQKERDEAYKDYRLAENRLVASPL